jgi:hypothetical protein
MQKISTFKIILINFIFASLLFLNFHYKIFFLILFLTLLLTFYFNFKLIFIVKSLISSFIFFAFFENSFFGICLSIFYFLLHNLFWFLNKTNLFPYYFIFAISFGDFNLFYFIIFSILVFLFEGFVFKNVILITFITLQVYLILNHISFDKIFIFLPNIMTFDYIKFYGKTNL